MSIARDRYEELNCAIDNDEPSVVKRFFEEFPHEINIINPSLGHKALLVKTVMGRHPLVLHELLKFKDIDLNQFILLRDEYESGQMAIMKTPLLCFLVRQNAFTMVCDFLKHPNIDVNVSDEYGRTSILIAAKHGYLHMVKELLKFPNINLDMTDDDGNSPLSIAKNEETRLLLQERKHANDIDISITKHQKAELEAIRKKLREDKMQPADVLKLRQQAQHILNGSLVNILKLTQDLQDYADLISHLDGIPEAVMGVAELVTASGAEYESAAHHLFHAAADMGDERALHIVESFGKGEAEEKVVSLAKHSFLSAKPVTDKRTEEVKTTLRQ